MSKKQITTAAAPAALGPYSQGIVAGGFFFASGQVPIDPATGELAGETVEAQARQVFANLEQVLAAAGCGFADVLKTTVFLTDLANFAEVNGIYAEYFVEPGHSAPFARLLTGIRSLMGQKMYISETGGTVLIITWHMS